MTSSSTSDTPSDFTPLYSAIEVLSAFDRAWMVASGWAIDLHLGRVTRPHKDVDVAVFREDQRHLRRHLAGWQLYLAYGGELHPWPEGEMIELPLHVIWAYAPGRRSPPASPSITDPDHQPDLEFLLNERDAGRWLYRHDPVPSLRGITRPLARACLRSKDGIPYLAPEIALLYKSRNRRDADEADFRAAQRTLDAEQREWLRSALDRTAPGHAWLVEL